MYELTVFVLIMTRENHDLAFVFFILYRFQGSTCASRAQVGLVYLVRRFLSTPFFHIFLRFLRLPARYPNIISPIPLVLFVFRLITA